MNMGYSLQQALEQEIEEKIGDSIHALQYTTKAAVRQIYWESHLRGEVPEKFLQDLDQLIDAVFKTTHRAGPKDESWPAYSEREVGPILEKIKAQLRTQKESK